MANSTVSPQLGDVLRYLERNKKHIVAEAAEFDKNIKYLEEHLSAFQKKYGGKVIIISKEKVVASGDSDKVIAEYCSKNKKIRAGDFITYVRRPNERFIFVDSCAS